MRDINFSPDGKRFLSTSYDKVVKLWDTETGQVIRTFGEGKMFFTAKFHPDPAKGNVLMAGAQDKKVYQWDMDSGDLVQACSWLLILFGAWSCNRQRCSSLPSSPLIRPRATCSWPAPSTRKAASGTWTLAILCRYAAFCWSLFPVCSFGGGKMFLTAKFHPDLAKGNVLMAGAQDKKVYQWDMDSGDLVQVRHPIILSSICTFGGGKMFLTAKFHPDPAKGNVLMAGAQDKKVYQWDMDSGDLVQVRHPIILSSICTFGGGKMFLTAKFHPDPATGNVLMAGAQDKKVYQWDMDSGDLVQVRHPIILSSICTFGEGKMCLTAKFHPDPVKGNVLMAGAQDKKVYQWDMDSGDLVQARSWLLNLFAASVV